VRLLAGIEPGIEPRQAQRAAYGERERGDPSKSWCGLKRPEEENQRRSRPESDVVRQRIELCADRKTPDRRVSTRFDQELLPLVWYGLL
jgi:hypothetical protein